MYEKNRLIQVYLLKCTVCGWIGKNTHNFMNEIHFLQNSANQIAHYFNAGAVNFKKWNF